ncbi:MAG: hypothetical protein EOO38_21275 [Cytophagaceae bacterium]|nr:MAG: hypothetical protein EOO38_21275 [Cytophagaceae bacterium]
MLAESVPGEGIFPLPKLDAFSRCLLVYTLHLQIYDWRQIMSVLNPCGLQRSVLALTRQQIGPQLTERRDWILKALDNWHAEYGVEESLSNEDQQPSKLDGCESVCGQLIYYLGILAIKISFADLQVLTGRSGSDADILIAKEALQNWLRKADVAKTIDITERMLELSIQTVTRGQSKDCALELFELLLQRSEHLLAGVLIIFISAGLLSLGLEVFHTFLDRENDSGGVGGIFIRLFIAFARK